MSRGDLRPIAATLNKSLKRQPVWRLLGQAGLAFTDDGQRMTITLRDLLNDGKVHVLDGAMGTMLYAKGFFLNVCYDELNLKQPKLVQEVHEAYVRAGAEILETNTFGANPLKLGSYGLADDTEKINQAAAELARRAAAGRASVAGAIGPLGVRIEPFGATSREEAFAHFQRQARGLGAGGVDGFILETFSDVDEIHEALRAVRSVSDLPVIAQMTIGDDGLTHYGTGPETFAKQQPFVDLVHVGERLQDE